MSSGEDGKPPNAGEASEEDAPQGDAPVVRRPDTSDDLFPDQPDPQSHTAVEVAPSGFIDTATHVDATAGRVTQEIESVDSVDDDDTLDLRKLRGQPTDFAPTSEPEDSASGEGAWASVGDGRAPDIITDVLGIRMGDQTPDLSSEETEYNEDTDSTSLPSSHSGGGDMELGSDMTAVDVASPTPPPAGHTNPHGQTAVNAQHTPTQSEAVPRQLDDAPTYQSHEFPEAPMSALFGQSSPDIEAPDDPPLERSAPAVLESPLEEEMDEGLLGPPTISEHSLAHAGITGQGITGLGIPEDHHGTNGPITSHDQHAVDAVAPSPEIGDDAAEHFQPFAQPEYEIALRPATPADNTGPDDEGGIPAAAALATANHTDVARYTPALPEYASGTEEALVDGQGAPPLSAEQKAVSRQRVLTLLQELKAADDPMQRVTLHLEIGTLFSDHLEQHQQARDHFEEALGTDPLNDHAFNALERILELTWDTDALVELLLDRQERLTDPQERLSLLERTADLYMQADDGERAQVVLQAAAALAPDDPEIEHRLARLGGIEEIHSGLVSYVSTLEPLAQAAGEIGGRPPATPPAPPEDPIALLQGELQRNLQPAERIEVLEQLAALLLRTGQTAEATRHLEEVLVVDDRREPAYRKLAQMHRQAGAHDRLANVLYHHAQVTNPAAAVELLRQLASLYEGPLADEGRAIDTYVHLRAIAPDDIATLRSLALLREKRQEWALALDVMNHLSNRLGRTQEAIELLQRQGCILEDHLEDPSAAEERYQAVLELQGSHAAAIQRLIGIYVARADWGKAARMHLLAEQHAASPSAKALSLLAAAKIQEHQLSNAQEAMELYHRCLQVDPDQMDAARQLASLKLRQGDHSNIRPLLELILRHTDAADVAARRDLLGQLGDVELAGGNPQQAYEYRRQALALAPDDSVAMLAFAQAALSAEDHRSAYDVFFRLYEARKHEGDEEGWRDLLDPLSKCALALNDHTAAGRFLDERLRAAPADQDTLATLAQVQQEKGHWPDLVQTKRKLAELAESPEAFTALQQEIGDLLRERLERDDEAAQAYKLGLEKNPKDRALLHRLVELYSKTKEWTLTVETCKRLAEIEETPQLKAKFFTAAATICQRELRDPDAAVRYYNMTLDANPQELKAFQAIDTILTEKRDWKGLEQSYGKMIKRLAAEGGEQDKGLQVMLWHNLGEVMRSRRRDFEAAIASFEVAQSLDPKNDQRAKILAELYVSCGEKYRDKAITAQEEQLQREPRRMSTYRKLKTLYMEDKRYDAAWCLCRALTFMQKAEREEEQFFRQYHGRRAKQAIAMLTPEVLQSLVLHPDQDALVSSIFANMAPAILSMTARPHGQFGLKRKEAQNPINEKDAFSQLFGHVTRVLGSPPLELYARPNSASGLQLALTTETTSIVAGVHVLSPQRPEREVLFLVAKQLSYLHPALLARVALPTRGELTAALLGAISLASPDFPLPTGDKKALKKNVDQLRKRLQPLQLEQIRRITRQLPALNSIDLDRWANGVDMTADRIGFLFADDLEAATRAISAEPDAGAIPPRERASALVRFSISPSYFEIRRLLGLNIG